METILIILGLLTFIVVEALACIKGLDLRRWSSWLYGGISFLSGFWLISILGGNFIESLKMGLIFAFLTLISGAAMRGHKQRYSGMAGPLLLKYGKEDDLSLFAKLVRRFLGKYK